MEPQQNSIGASSRTAQQEMARSAEPREDLSAQPAANTTQPYETPRPANDFPFARPAGPARFTFIDLFAGIGGFRLGLQQAGGQCLFSCEWDKYARQTYYANFGEFPSGDITLEVTKASVPKHYDVLTAGFPCQPFSISGRTRGFEDARGTFNLRSL